MSGLGMSSALNSNGSGFKVEGSEFVSIPWVTLKFIGQHKAQYGPKGLPGKALGNKH